MTAVTYMRGFGNEFSSEAENYPGAIPKNSINPQQCPYGLYAEQLSGTAFTAPRGTNRRTWLYRMKPSVFHKPLKRMRRLFAPVGQCAEEINPNQRRWHPIKPNWDLNRQAVDFVDGIELMAFSDRSNPASVAIYVYMANEDMKHKTFSNSDGDFLIVPQMGKLLIKTEFGPMIVEPNEIVVIQQGMKFTVNFDFDQEEPRGKKFARGYILEVRGNHFELPNLGPIGANGLANARDFLVPQAAVDRENFCGHWTNLVKFQNELWAGILPGSPYDVAGWFGNYVPFKYELSRFVSMNSVSVDHPDPSIFTVLTCPYPGRPGTALADFVIFPPRWECASDTFRPPYYHRNCMTEFMGLIKGQYQAKGSKFAPGGASLHQAMMPHGPDMECYQMASKQDTSKPKRVADETMAFMFETSLPLMISDFARLYNNDHDYHKCWEGFEKISLK